MKSIECWNCGALQSDVPQPISRHANCSKCFEVLRCCRMCVHYRELDHIKCAEDRADPPVVKESANFCEFFRPASNAFVAKARDNSGAAKSSLNALFGREDDSEDDSHRDQESFDDGDKPKTVRSPLDDLFED